MTAMDILKKVLAGDSDIDAAAITEDTPIDSFGLDSLDMVELICVLEDEMEIDFGEPEGLKTVGDVARYADELAGN